MFCSVLLFNSQDVIWLHIDFYNISFRNEAFPNCLRWTNKPECIILYPAELFTFQPVSRRYTRRYTRRLALSLSDYWCSIAMKHIIHLAIQTSQEISTAEDYNLTADIENCCCPNGLQIMVYNITDCNRYVMVWANSHLFVLSLASHFPLGQSVVRMTLTISPAFIARSSLRPLVVSVTLALYKASSSPVIYRHT